MTGAHNLQIRLANIQATNNNLRQEVFTGGDFSFSTEYATSIVRTGCYFVSTKHNATNKRVELAPAGLQIVLLESATIPNEDNVYFRVNPEEGHDGGAGADKAIDMMANKVHLTGSLNIGKNARSDTDSGYISLEDGHEDYPVIRFRDDDDCGFFRPANVSLGVTISGAERFRFTYASSAATFHSDGDIIGFSTTISDIRFKENINPIENALFKIKSLKGVEFDWKDEYKERGHDFGFIAQEVEKVDGLDTLVTEGFNLRTKREDVKVVSYEKVVPLLVEAVKEQQIQIDELKKKLEEI